MCVLLQDKPISVCKMAKQRRRNSVLVSPATAWTKPPEYVFEAVVEHMQGDREVSAVFRQVCRAWREAHDRLITVLKPSSAPRDARVWRKFGGVKTLHFWNEPLERTFGELADDDVKKALASLVSLNTISLGGGITDAYERVYPNVTDKGMRMLSLLTTLTSLDLRGCRRVTDKGMRTLSQLSTLTFLDLSWCEAVTDNGVRSLASLTALTSLNVCRCRGVSDKGLRALAPLTALTNLNLAYCRVSDEGLRALAPLTALTDLDLSYCDTVSDEGLRALSPLTALTSLNLTQCDMVTDEGLTALAPLTALTNLSLSYCHTASDVLARHRMLDDVYSPLHPVFRKFS
jgi:bacterioferritin-associated ferredoxin